MPDGDSPQQRVRFGKRLGSGGFGEVLEAVRINDGLECAVKRLVDLSEDSRRRFLREVRMQSQLRHLNIMPILGSALDANPPWFLMPRAKDSLRDRLQHGHGEQFLPVIVGIAKGLKHAHLNGVVHRDLKPENVLFLDDGKTRRPTIADFGLGRLMTRDTTTLTLTNVGLGTVAYMAPEQFKDSKNVDARADLYALGKILFEVLTGVLPYPEMEDALLPPKFIYLVRKATAGKPDDRYQTVEQFLADLVTITDGEDLFTKPAERVRTETQRVLENGAYGAEDVAPLARMIAQHADDNVVLTKLLPRLPDPILDALVRHHGEALHAVFLAYDEVVSGGLPFEACDVVADFYERLFNVTTSRKLRRMILRRLPLLAYSHNRWYVGRVFGRLVGSLTDPGLVLDVRDVFRENPSVAGWCREYLDEHSLPSSLRESIPPPDES